MLSHGADSGDRRQLILVCDCNALSLSATAEALRSAGFEVVETTSSEECEAVALHRRPDLVLVDRDLQDGAASDICGRIMADRAGPAIAVMTWPPTHAVTGSADSHALLLQVQAFLRLSTAEHELAEANSEWRRTFDAIPDMVMVIDTESRIHRANRATIERLGVSLNDLRQMKCFEAFHCASEAPEYCPHACLKDDAGEHSVTCFADGVDAELHVTVTPLEGPGGEVLGAVHVARDITELSRVQDERDRAARISVALAELSTSLIAHHPIAEISGFVLDKARELTESAHGFVGYIDRATGHLVSPTLTRDIWEACQVDEKSVVFEEFTGLWGWVLNEGKPLLTNTPGTDQRSSGIPGGHLPIRRFLSAPAVIGGEVVGQVSLANAPRDYTDRDLELAERLAAIFALAVDRDRREAELAARQHDLGERVKEIKCLYGVSRLVARADATLESIFTKGVDLLPGGWQYPEVTCGRIVFDGATYLSEGYVEPLSHLASEIFVRGRCRGYVVVGYFEERPEADGGPFILEEGDLLNGVAEHLGRAAERLETEAELRQREEIYRETVESAPVGIFKTTSDGRMISANQGLADILGYDSAQQLISAVNEASIGEVLYAEPEARPAILARLLDHEGWLNYENRYRRRDGAVIDILLRSRAVELEDGGVGFEGFIEEITERKRAEEALREAKEAAETASRAKTDFLARMSHEMRTPLNAMLGMADLLSTTDLDTEQLDFLDTARTSAEHLLDLISDLLDLSRIEAGRVELQSTPFRLRENMEALCKALAHHAGEKGVELSCRVLPDVPDLLEGDIGRLRQVLNNLIGNAVKFTHRGDVRVTVAAIRQNETEAMLRFAVADTGIGIPEEYHDSIFDSFAQADMSLTREYGGTGLGLAISRQLVEMLGGEIWVESDVGEGSTFRFTAGFPVKGDEDEAVAPAVHAPAIEVAAGGRDEGMKILLAEDDPASRKVTSRLLCNMGHSVVAAVHGAEAVDAHSREAFDLILMDLEMPKMNGLEATVAIRERESETGRRTPIVAMTAHAFDDHEKRCLDAGMDRVLTKPVRREHLRAMIGSYAEEARRGSSG